MATHRKHIAVYLHPLVEQALTAFCEQKRLKSKKGIMYSAGINAVLAEFFGIPDTDLGTSVSINVLDAASNILDTPSHLRILSTIQAGVASATNTSNAAGHLGILSTIQAGVSSATNARASGTNILEGASSISAAAASKLRFGLASNILAPSDILGGARSVSAEYASKLGAGLASNILAPSDILGGARSVSAEYASNKFPQSIDLEVLPGKFQA